MYLKKYVEKKYISVLYLYGRHSHLELLWHLNGHHLLGAQLGRHKGQQAAA